MCECEREIERGWSISQRLGGGGREGNHEEDELLHISSEFSPKADVYIMTNPLVSFPFPYTIILSFETALLGLFSPGVNPIPNFVFTNFLIIAVKLECL